MMENDLGEFLARVDKFVEESNFNLESMPEVYKDLYLINVLNYDISNGGVYQWLVNRCGGYVDDTINALYRVGAFEVAEIVKSIVDGFPGCRVPRDEVERISVIESMVERFDVQWKKKGDMILDWPDDIGLLLEKYINK